MGRPDVQLDIEAKIRNFVMVYMWQEERGKSFYRFQTENKKAAEKMKRRKKFKLTASGYNCDFWIFLAEFSRPSKARNVLRTLSGGIVEYDKKDEVYFAKINKTKHQKQAA